MVWPNDATGHTRNAKTMSEALILFITQFLLEVDAARAIILTRRFGKR